MEVSGRRGRGRRESVWPSASDILACKIPTLGTGANVPFISGSLYILLGFFNFVCLHLSTIAMATAIDISKVRTPATTAPAIMGANELVLPEIDTKEVGRGEEVEREGEEEEELEMREEEGRREEVGRGEETGEGEVKEEARYVSTE